MTTIRRPDKLQHARWKALADLEMDSVFGLKEVFDEGAGRLTLVSAIPEGVSLRPDEESRARRELADVFALYGDKKSDFAEQVFVRGDGRYVLLGVHWFQRFVLSEPAYGVFDDETKPVDEQTIDTHLNTVAEMDTEPLPIGIWARIRRW